MIKQNIKDVRKTAKRLDFPKEVIIETSAYCNLNCTMCPQSRLTRERGHMDNGLFVKIVNEVSQESPKSRIWPAIMGEPLLDPGIYDKMKIAQDAGAEICFNTNAVLLEIKNAERLIDSGVVDYYIGLDALKKDTYDKIRKGGDYQAAVRNTLALIPLVREAGGTVYAQFIDQDDNEVEREDFIKFWTGEGAAVKVRPRLGWGLGIETNSLVVPNSERDFPCPWITRTMSIHWNGQVVQCDADWDNKDVVGDVNNQTIKEIWDGELHRRRERQWALDFAFGNCDKCKDWQAGTSYFYYPEKK